MRPLRGCLGNTANKWKILVQSQPLTNWKEVYINPDMTIIDRNTCPIECYEKSSKKAERNLVIQKNMIVSSSNLRPNLPTHNT